MSIENYIKIFNILRHHLLETPFGPDLQLRRPREAPDGRAPPSENQVMSLTKTKPTTTANSRPGHRREDRPSLRRAARHPLLPCGQRVVLTYRPRDRSRDDLPARPIALDALRLFTMTSRQGTGRHGPSRSQVVLAVYKPTIDLPGSGRIRFVPVRVEDVADSPLSGGPEDRTVAVLHQALGDPEQGVGNPFVIFPQIYYAYARRRPPVAEPMVPRPVWEAAEVDLYGYRAWPAELLARPEGLRFTVHPVHGRSRPWSRTRAIAEGTILDDWIMRGGVPTPMAQEPEAVFVAVDHLRGRRMANPAVGVLQRHGLLPTGPEFARWLRTLGPVVDGRRQVHDPRDEATPAGRFRTALEHYVLGGPDREAALRAALRAACAMRGVPLPHGEHGHDAETELLLSPWTGLEDPAAVAVQRLGRVARTFSTGTVAVDFELVP